MSMTSSLCAVGTSSLQWLELLEGEFDRLFRELRLDLSALLSMEDGPGAVARGMKDNVGAFASVFAQLVHKSKTVFQTNCKLEATLIDVQSEVLQARTECNQLRRELKARTLAARSLEVQLRQTGRQERDDPTTRELDTLRAQLELEVERYHQSQSMEEKLAASVVQLQEENSTLHQYVGSLTSQLAATALTSKYQQKELAGRIQQLQLVASGVRGDNLKALWQQITTEISLQKNKALLMAYHMRDKSVDGLLPPAEDDGKSASSKSQELRERVLEYASQREREGEVPPCRQVRDITIVRKEREPLGMTITGGSDHGVPVMISNLDRGKPAHSSGLLQIGDAILSVNGHSLSGKTHEDAVQLLKSASNTFRFKVVFIVGVPSSEEEESNREEEGSEASEIDCELPPKASVGLPPSSTNLHSSRSRDASSKIEPPPLDSPRNALAKPPSLPRRDADTSTSETGALIQSGNARTLSDEEDTEQTTAQRLVSAFYLTPTSSEQLPSSYSEDADIAMFRYDQPDNPALSPTATTVPKLHVSSVTHLLRVAGPPTIAMPPPEQATVATPTATPTSAVTPIVTAITTPTETTDGNQLLTSPKETGNSLYQMTLTAVPIQNMQIPTFSDIDGDDVPLFSI